MKTTGALLVAILVGGFAVQGCTTPATKAKRFEGACIYLEGKVEGDVCIKNGKVVLTKKEFETK